MDNKRYEFNCQKCGNTWSDGGVDTCPACGEEYAIKRVTVIECCGEDLYCDGFTNTCEKCGRDYNWAGQALAPRSQWGEETGESLAEILSVDSTSPEDLLEGE